jgi:dienelactone hydrolase
MRVEIGHRGGPLPDTSHIPTLRLQEQDLDNRALRRSFMKCPTIALAALGYIATIAAASKAQTETPALPSLLAMKVSDEEGYRIEEGFLRVKINNRLVLLQGLVVKKADAVGKLPIMILTHGTNSSARERQEMTPRGTKDSDLRLLRAYAQRGWLTVYALRRGYGQSDGPIPVAVTKCDGSPPSVQEFFDADADDLEAVVTSIVQREDADPDRIMAFGVSGGGGAVVALSARNIPGLKVIINVSGGLRTTGCSDAQNHERLIAAARYYGTKSKVPNLWYYAETDEYVPGPTAAEMRSAYLEGGGYARLTHYGKITDSVTDKEVNGHQLWSKQRVQIMVDIDNYLRSAGLPTWDINEAKRLGEKIKTPADRLEGYLAAPGYKALALSTTNNAGLRYYYGAATLELAKEGALTACNKSNPEHICKIVDPPESKQPPQSEEATKVKATDQERPITP